MTFFFSSSSSSSRRRCLFFVLILFFCGPPRKLSVEGAGGHGGSYTTEKSPYFQHLPNCERVVPQLSYVYKKTKSKGIVCPMVKDEEGFLSEWTAFYEMQGFDKVIFYDNNSTLSFSEVDPWVKDGFVEIRRYWWVNDTVLNSPGPKGKPRQKFDDMMRIKMLAEVDCKQTAVALGMEIFVSVDMDEYLFPSRNDLTAMDELSEWFNSTTRGFVLLDKLNFPATPHLLEPVHLLTIEAYQTRHPIPNKMNYYSSVSNKVALRLQYGPEYNADTVQMMVNCCDFHGCGNFRFNKTCPQLIGSETGKVAGKHRSWKQPPHLHHYARSLEKYVLKSKTWETASGHDASGYNIYNYFDRTLGFEFDDTALRWSCQLRSLLANRTGLPFYVRPGDFWYRNPEYGKLVSDPKKRARYGRGEGLRVSARDMNPYPPGATYQGAHKVYEPPTAAKPAPEKKLLRGR